MRQGNALDAPLASLRANAEHGKRREAADYRGAYQIAVNHRPIKPTDSDRVVAVLCCSERWARELTSEARERERILRDEVIVRARQEGKTSREAAR